MKIMFRIIVKKTRYTKKSAGDVLYFKEINFSEEYRQLCFHVEPYGKNGLADLPGSYNVDIYNEWEKYYLLSISLDNGKTWIDVEKDKPMEKPC
jgi:hypothetical protein